MFFEVLLTEAYLSEQPPREDEIVLLPQNIRTGIDDGLYVSRSRFEELLVKYRAEEPMSEGAFMSLGKTKDPDDPLWNILLGIPVVVRRYSELCNDKALARLQANEEQEVTEGAEGAMPDAPAEVLPDEAATAEDAGYTGDGDDFQQEEPESYTPTAEMSGDEDAEEVAEVGEATPSGAYREEAVVETGYTDEVEPIGTSDTMSDDGTEEFTPPQYDLPDFGAPGGVSTPTQDVVAESDRAAADDMRAILGQPPISQAYQVNTPAQQVDTDSDIPAGDDEPVIPDVEYTPGQSQAPGTFNPWAEYDAQQSTEYPATDAGQEVDSSAHSRAESALAGEDEDDTEESSVVESSADASSQWDINNFMATPPVAQPIYGAVPAEGGTTEVPSSESSDYFSGATDTATVAETADVGDVPGSFEESKPEPEPEPEPEPAAETDEWISMETAQDAERAMRNILHDFLRTCEDYGVDNVCTQAGTSLVQVVTEMCNVLPGLLNLPDNSTSPAAYVASLCDAVWDRCEPLIMQGALDTVDAALQPIIKVIYMEV